MWIMHARIALVHVDCTCTFRRRPTSIQVALTRLLTNVSGPRLLVQSEKATVDMSRHCCLSPPCISLLIMLISVLVSCGRLTSWLLSVSELKLNIYYLVFYVRCV